MSSRPDWNAIRAEYIGGGISQRKLAKKYGIAEGTLLDRANKEGWKTARDRASSKSITDAEQKTAEAAASNAVKLEEARGLILDAALEILRTFPRHVGNKVKSYGKDKKGNKVSGEFNLLELTGIIDKLASGSMGAAEYDPVLDRLNAELDAEIYADE